MSPLVPPPTTPKRNGGSKHTIFTVVGIFCCTVLLRTTTSKFVDAYAPRHPPFIRQQDLIGIWKLSHTNLQLPTTTTPTTTDDDKQAKEETETEESLSSSSSSSSSSTNGSSSTTSNNAAINELVFRLNEDGTFDPYTQTPEEGDPLFYQILGRGGTWTYQDKALILAANRPDEEGADPSNQIHDTVLAGKLQVHTSVCLPATDQAIVEYEEEEVAQNADASSGGETTTSSSINSDQVGTPHQDTTADEIDVQLSVPEGQVLIGKFMYPKKHKAFFDEPMLFHQSCIGSFAISQLLGNLNARLKEERETPKPVAKFHKKDFYGRRFYLTAAPHKINPTYAALDVHFDEDKVVHDIRVMPISFHANNTFTAEGTEKTLRGRYGIAGAERDRLWFQVSLFGAGRSAPGSVYSEGRLLSHDDRRGYVGNIQTTVHPTTNQTLHFIEGEIYFGTDLKNPLKPNSMGVFSMQEIVNDDDEVDDEDYDDDDDDDEFDDDDDDDNESDSDGSVQDFEVSDDAFQ